RRLHLTRLGLPPGPRPSVPPPKEVTVLGKLLVRHLRPYWPLLVGVVVFQLAQSIASLYLPALNADIIDDGVAKGDTEFIIRTGLLMLAITLGQIAAAILAVYFGAKA